MAIVLGVPFIFVCRDEIRDLIRRITSISPKTGIKVAPRPPQEVPSTSVAGPAITSVDLSRQLAANVDPYVLDQRINGICAELTAAASDQDIERSF
jgi:hypothetical protein